MTRSRQCALIGHRANPPLRDPDAGKKCPTPRTENVLGTVGRLRSRTGDPAPNVSLSLPRSPLYHLLYLSIPHPPSRLSRASPHEPKAYQRQHDSQCMQRSMPVVSSLSYRLLSIRYRMPC
ncbi:hypothetical protein DENSPDRAFT_835940 [Dentipellis sp. KUC8613]|nr:hypothetical protein DENSPDRAFT_835940 [Dentipellis sp. KUC8613]